MRQPRTCGQRSAYVEGCRCDACRAANTAYMRARRGSGPALPVRREPVPGAWIPQDDGRFLHRCPKSGPRIMDEEMVSQLQGCPFCRGWPPPKVLD